MCAATPVVGVVFFFLSNVGSGDLSQVLMLAREGPQELSCCPAPFWSFKDLSVMAGKAG